MQRVKEPDAFVADLERPLDGTAREVTEEDLERDAASFMAFAAAFGVKPPQPSPDPPAATA